MCGFGSRIANGATTERENAWGELPYVQLAALESTYLDALSDCVELDESGTSDLTLTAVSDALLEDDFSVGYGLWTEVTDGTVGTPAAWSITSGRLEQTAAVGDGSTDRSDASKLGTMVLAGLESWTDVSVEVRLRSDDGAVGLAFRYSDGDGVEAYYRLSVDRTLGYRRLVRVVEGVVTTLFEDLDFDYDGRISIGLPGAKLETPPDAYPAGEDFTLAIQCQGSRIRAQLDDQLLFDLEDEDALLFGRCGLYTHGTATASFDYVLVAGVAGLLDETRGRATPRRSSRRIPCSTKRTATRRGRPARTGRRRSSARSRSWATPTGRRTRSKGT